MAYVCIKSRALNGIEALPVAVEVDLSPGTGHFTMVGLAEIEVRESKDRVRTAIINSQFEWPLGNLTINLAPADLPKESGRFDLPIALGILAVSGVISAAALENYEFAGELSLSGELRPIRGALTMVWRMMHTQHTFVLPEKSAAEACLVEGAHIIGAKHLLDITAHLRGIKSIPLMQHTPVAQTVCYPDLRDVKGQLQAKRVLEIAAAGQHNLLMIGPPGTGKSMLAQRLPGILPPMTSTEALESAAVQSLIQGSFMTKHFCHRPYRAPHHTASAAALVGGGSNPRPGEISLAHHGVLFLDELAEFDRRVLEVMREPMESGRIIISRAAHKLEFPANFQLIAAMNPCPCGYYSHPKRECRCTHQQIEQYSRKISGPLLDRIDLSIEVPSLSSYELQRAANGQSSAEIRERVEQAFKLQIARQGVLNAQLNASQLDQVCPLTKNEQQLLSKAIDRLALSARAYYRILKVARTIADLEGAQDIRSSHLSEAIQYRRARLLQATSS